MRARSRRRWRFALVLCALGSVVGLASMPGSADEPAARRPAAIAPLPAVPRAPPPAPENLLEGFDPRHHVVNDGVAEAALSKGRKAILTLDPGLQAHVAEELARFEVPYASLVAIEPSTGRVLAYVSHSTANPDAPDLALDPTPPAASVFKVVTGAALLDAGVGPNREVCYSGGLSSLSARDLEDDPSRDRYCATFEEAMGGSINAVFAKLANRHLDRPTLERYAAAFGFGHALPFDVPTSPSPAEVPKDRLERARTAAGFWHMHMSPLHASLIAATIANDGNMPRPGVVDRVIDARGHVLYQFEPEVFRPVIGRATARTLGHMMERTVTHGTARKTFFDPNGNPFLPDIRVAGKTGTLSAERPYRGYTWWVGFAPADSPTIAVAALVVNTPRWRIKASYVAREALRYYLVEKPATASRDGQ